MNDHEKYLFDLRGYIAVENALSTEQLTALNQIMDRHIEADCTADMRTHRFGGLLDWGAAYRGLIANERVVPYVEQIEYAVTKDNFLALLSSFIQRLGELLDIFDFRISLYRVIAHVYSAAELE